MTVEELLKSVNDYEQVLVAAHPKVRRGKASASAIKEGPDNPTGFKKIFQDVAWKVPTYYYTYEVRSIQAFYCGELVLKIDIEGDPERDRFEAEEEQRRLSSPDKRKRPKSQQAQ